MFGSPITSKQFLMALLASALFVIGVSLLTTVALVSYQTLASKSGVLKVIGLEIIAPHIEGKLSAVVSLLDSADQIDISTVAKYLLVTPDPQSLVPASLLGLCLSCAGNDKLRLPQQMSHAINRRPPPLIAESVITQWILMILTKAIDRRVFRPLVFCSPLMVVYSCYIGGWILSQLGYL
ncbi:hypothetical protein BSZ39_02420 [Bowdeniella nasicola]|uniref:Uncharacterized protein n=1 Tax=Bowdeniella nasicola TaxID=208480 RepID=A0A1Q5Q4L0_9ACTO|nr:hypothetical protein BSZ39_02420 [Bowdeniella nasicola]